MELIQEVNQFIKNNYPNLSETINIETFLIELKKVFTLNSEIDNQVIEEYLLMKGYKNIECSQSEQSKPLSTKSQLIDDEDFSLDDFFSEFDPEELIISEVKSFKDNNLLFEKISENSFKNNEIIDQLVKNNQNLVKKIAFKYTRISKSLTDDDLINEGNLGLLKAIERYDVSKGYEFSTYATYWIRQTITRAIADKDTIIRIPVHAYESINKIRKIERTLALKKPDYSVEDILITHGDLSLEKYFQLKEIEFKYLHDVSLNAYAGEDYGDEIIDFISDLEIESLELSNNSASIVEEVILKNDLHEKLLEIISNLSEREQEIIKYRFGFIDDKLWTLEEIGKLFGVTRERIRQIESKALGKLRNTSKSLKVFIESY